MKHKKVIIGAIILAAGVGAFILYNKKKKKDLAAKKPAATPATPVTPAKTSGADGDDNEDSNFAAGVGRWGKGAGTVYIPTNTGYTKKELVKMGVLTKEQGGSWK